MLYYLIGELCLVSLICFARYVFLYHSKNVAREAKQWKLRSYDIGQFVKKFRNTDNKLLSSTHHSMSSKKSKKKNKQFHQLPVTPAILDSAHVGVNTLYQYMYIDDSMYKGVSEVFNEVINNVSDLSSQLKVYTQEPGEFVANNFRKLKEYVADSSVVKYFKEVGIEGNWSEFFSHQENWNTLIDNNPIQLEYIKSSNQLIENFQQQPLIPVTYFFNEDGFSESTFYFRPVDSIDHLFNSFKKISQKTTNMDNSSVAQEDLTKNIEESAELLSRSAVFDFPWITAAFSGFREAQLLMRNYTDILSSLKNAGLDVAGTAIGGGIGGTIGATIGSLIFPGIGTVAGVTLGVLGGNLLGRTITNDIKQEPLRKAVIQLKNSTKILKTQEIKTEKKYQNKFKKDKTEAQEKLNQSSSKAKQKINEEIQVLRQWVVNRERLSKHLGNHLLKQIPTKITSLIKEFKLSWTEFFWPSRKTIVYKKKINEIKNTLGKQLHNKTIKDRVHLLEKLSEAGVCHSYVFSEIKKIETLRKKHEKLLMQKIRQSQSYILNQRLEHMKILTTRTTKYVQQIRTELLPYVRNIKNYQDLVKEEAKKLGIDRPLVKHRNQSKNRNTPLKASNKLAKIVGTKKITRQKAFQTVWNYIKKKNLRDTENTQNIKLDPTLKSLFGNKKQTNILELTKTIDKHLYNKTAG